MLTGAACAGKLAINYWTDYQLEYGLADRLAFTAEQENWYDTDRFYLEETILMAKVKVFDFAHDPSSARPACPAKPMGHTEPRRHGVRET